MQVPPVGGAAATPSPFAPKPVTKQKDDPRSEFLAMVDKSPAEQMRDQVLRSLGVTEEELKAMGPEQREKIEEKIREIIRHKVEQSVEKKTGVIVDMKA